LFRREWATTLPGGPHLAERTPTGEPTEPGKATGPAPSRPPRASTASTDGRAEAEGAARLAREGDLEGAVRAFERAHYLRPEDPHILFQYAVALEEAGRDEEADLRFYAARRLAARAREARAAARARPAPRHGPPVEGEGADGASWEPEPAAPLADIGRQAGFVWAEQPLLWTGAFLLPNLLALLLTRAASVPAWAALLVWTAAFGAGGAVALPGMWSQVREDDPAPDGYGELLRRAGGAARLLLPYLLVTVGIYCAALARQSRLPPDVIAMSSLFATAPFHALLAPALLLNAGRRAGPFRAIMLAFRLAGRRSWLYLALMLMLAAVLAWVLAVWRAGAWELFRGAGELVNGLVAVLGISAAQSLWTALIAACGLDALRRLPEDGP
jgi:hypothetical protein